MNSQRVSQAEAAQTTKSCTLSVRSHNCSSPKLGIVNILILWSDIKIATYDEVLGRSFPEAMSKPVVPIQLVLVRRRANSLSIWRINREYAHLADRRRDYARLRIEYFIAKR